MAETKETVVLDFQINEGEAISSLEKTKKSIIDLKQQQTELNKAYKEGTISLDAYAKESVQLEASLKKQQAAYSAVQRQVTGLKNPFDKLNQSIKDQAKNVTIAGVSLSTFLNPVTATIGVLGGLFKAYSSSTIGAKDLTFASNQLSAATGILTNEFASLFSSAKDGGGFFTGLINTILQGLGPAGQALAAQSKALAMAQEGMEDLGREEIAIRSDMNERLEENAEKLSRIQDSQTDINEKTALVGEILVNLRKNEEDLLGVKQKQLDILNRQLAADPENERIQTAVLEKEKEISRIKSDTERKVQNIIKLESNLKDADDKKTEAAIENIKKQDEVYYQSLKDRDDAMVAMELDQDIRDAERREAKIQKEEETTSKIIEIGNRRLKELEKLYGKEGTAFRKKEDTKTRIAKLEEQTRLMALSAGLGQAAALFGEETVAHKFMAVARATIDTYVAANAAMTAGPILGPILAAFAIAAGLANVGKILEVSAAAGGGSFMTKGPQLLLVGDNPGGVERVEVTPVSGRGKTVVGKNMVAMAGGGVMYTDASIAAGGSSSQQAAKTMKVELVYSEFKTFEDGIKYKNEMAEA